MNFWFNLAPSASNAALSCVRTRAQPLQSGSMLLATRVIFTSSLAKSPKFVSVAYKTDWFAPGSPIEYKKGNTRGAKQSVQNSLFCNATLNQLLKRYKFVSYFFCLPLSSKQIPHYTCFLTFFLPRTILYYPELYRYPQAVITYIFLPFD